MFYFFVHSKIKFYRHLQINFNFCKVHVPQRDQLYVVPSNMAEYRTSKYIYLQHITNNKYNILLIIKYHIHNIYNINMLNSLYIFIPILDGEIRYFLNYST